MGSPTMTRSLIRLLAAMSITCAAAGAQAQQTLARGVVVSDIGATTQTDTQTTTLRATLVNQRQEMIPLLTVRYELYDAQGAVVGEATTSRAELAPGQKWVADVQTPVPFTRFTLMNVDAQ